jgi:hypothetical protein
MLEMWRGRPACERVPFIGRRDACPTGLSHKLKFLGALSVFSALLVDAFMMSDVSLSRRAAALCSGHEAMEQ